MGAPGCGPMGGRRGPPIWEDSGLPSHALAISQAVTDTPLAWLGDGAAESRMHVRTPTCSVETPSAIPGSPPLQPALLWIGCLSPQHALNSVLVTARTTSVLRDCKVIFVERFCLRLSVVLRALEDRDAGSFSAPSLAAFCLWTS